MLLVFLGAYVAFWLRNARQEVRRHDQFLAVLKHELTDALQNAKSERIKAETELLDRIRTERQRR